MFVAQDQEDVFLIQGGDALQKLKKMRRGCHQNGPVVIGIRVGVRGQNAYGCLESICIFLKLRT